MPRRPLLGEAAAGGSVHDGQSLASQKGVIRPFASRIGTAISARLYGGLYPAGTIPSASVPNIAVPRHDPTEICCAIRMPNKNNEVAWFFQGFHL